VTDDDLRGKVAIASFIFTRCPTVCPVVSMKMQRLAERLRGESRVVLLSFSVDPEHDTPAVLAKFAARFGADPTRWKFLTGPAGAIRSAVEGSLKIAMDRQGVLADGAPDIVHGTHLVLIDGSLRIRGYYDYSEPARIDDLARDARALAAGETR
jgi:protein SCO1/2